MDGLIMLLIKLIVCNWKALPGVSFAGGLNRIIKSKKRLKKKSLSPEAPARRRHKARRSWDILPNKLQTLVISARGLSYRNENLNCLHTPASFVKDFRSEVPFSYIQTSLFTWRSPASKMTSVAVHIPCMSGYQTTVEKLNGPCLFLIFYLPIKGLYCSIKQ